MILQSGALSELILKIEKLVTSCHKLEKDMGVTIEKNQVINMAESIVAVVNKHVTDKVVMAKIVEEIKLIFRKPSEVK